MLNLGQMCVYGETVYVYPSHLNVLQKRQKTTFLAQSCTNPPIMPKFVFYEWNQHLF